MVKLSPKRFFRSNIKLSSKAGEAAARGCSGEIKWEMRPGGMLVQKRESEDRDGEGLITIRVSTVHQWHDVTIRATSTFGELKMILSIVTNLEPREQRILFKGKEREDYQYLHMVGIKDNDKVLLLEDPAIKERKLHNSARGRDEITRAPCRTISV